MIFFLILYPTIFTIASSFRFYHLKYPADTQRWTGIDNYLTLVADDAFIASATNTFILVAFSVLLTFLIGLILAMAVNRVKQTRIQSTLSLIFILPMMFAPAMVAILMMIIFDMNGGLINILIDTITGTRMDVPWFVAGKTIFPFSLASGDFGYGIWTMTIIDIWQWAPFCFLIFLAGIQLLPKEPYEAATIDGASSWRIFRHITLPLLKPTILVIIMFRVAYSFRVLEYIYILTYGGPGYATEVLSFTIYRVGYFILNIGYGCAMSVALLIFATITCTIILRSLWEVI